MLIQNYAHVPSATPYSILFEVDKIYAIQVESVFPANLNRRDLIFWLKVGVPLVMLFFYAKVSRSSERWVALHIRLQKCNCFSKILIRFQDLAQDSRSCSPGSHLPCWLLVSLQNRLFAFLSLLDILNRIKSLKKLKVRAQVVGRFQVRYSIPLPRYVGTVFHYCESVMWPGKLGPYLNFQNCDKTPQFLLKIQKNSGENLCICISSFHTWNCNVILCDIPVLNRKKTHLHRNQTRFSKSFLATCNTNRPVHLVLF